MKLQNLYISIEGLIKQQLNGDYSIELVRQISVLQNKIEVLECRMSGNYVSRYDMVSIPPVNIRKQN